MFRTFTQAIANMQCPFDKNLAVIEKGISSFFMSNCGRHRPALCHRQISHERELLFLLKSNDCRLRHVSACAWGFAPASGFNFLTSLSTIVPCNIFEPRSTLAETCGRRRLFFADGTANLKEIKVCTNGYSQFLYVPNEVRLFSFLLNERFALGLDCGDLVGDHEHSI